MTILDEDYSRLSEEISIGSSSNGIPKTEEFFKIYSELAADNGDCPDLDYSPILNGSGYRVDGYAFDIPDNTEGASGDLYLAVCVFFQEEELPSINAKDIDKAVTEVTKFLKLAVLGKKLDELEESSHDFRLAMLIRDYVNQIARVRILVFTNAHLKIRKKVFEATELNKLSIHTNVFDIERYSKISSTGTDPVEIDFIENFLLQQINMPCRIVDSFVVPGELHFPDVSSVLAFFSLVNSIPSLSWVACFEY